jgi:phage nucleotide-binding protein
MTDTQAPPAFDLASLVRPVSESARYLKLLVYGDPKVGKTTFAATAPAPLFLTVEPGTVVLLKNEENRERFADVQTVDLKSITRLNQIMAALREGQMPERKTIVLDSLSEFQHRILMQWSDHAMKSGLTKLNNPYAPEWPEYNSVTNILKKAMWELRDLDRHIIVIAHDRDDEDKNKGGMRIHRPALMPALGNTLAAMFNLVGRMFRDSDGVVKMKVVASPTEVAGSHLWDGPPVIENPTFDTFSFERATTNGNATG